MSDHYNLVTRLTTDLPTAEQARQINDFIVELGWRPSDRLELPGSRDFTTAHLTVEQGLEYTVVITFLLHPNRFVDLTTGQKKILANGSYNNLVDWHISVDYESVTFLYNRFRPPEFHTIQERLSRTSVDVLQSSNFQRLTAKHPVPDVPALDRAVVETISLWKRQLGGEYPELSIQSLSALFNSLLFVRAAEDHKRQSNGFSRKQLLLDVADHLASSQNGAPSLRGIVAAALENLEVARLPEGLVELEALGTFDDLDRELTLELLQDLYRNRFAQFYDYDFSLISKHALSRIYEHYVSVLRVPVRDQLSFLPRMATESLDRAFGNVYTPEFIARFFARYLRLRLPLRTFQRLKVIDPCCGSGIFLRAFLELQNELFLDWRTTDTIRATFDNIIGIDVDPNACHAARLSLSLLSLVLVDQLPQRLRIENEEALAYFLSNEELKGTCDVVVANPPYIKLEAQSPELKERISTVLSDTASGRPDLYLAILRMSLDLLKPGGFGLFVLPETFLKATSAAGIRKFLADHAWIHCVVDLTAVKVFEDVGVYTILIIFRRKSSPDEPGPTARVVRCQDRVAQALQDVLDDRVINSQFYTIHEATQDAFQGEEWSLAPPTIALMLRKYSQLSKLGAECRLGQGMNTGADDIFTRPNEAVPEEENDCYLPLLSDREMELYTIPESTANKVFYPFRDLKSLTETELETNFPRTWEYLVSFKDRLEQRSAVRRGTLPWWRPERPRKPKDMLVPKLVTPHVVIAPKFAFDPLGRYAVSRAPLVFSTLTGAAQRDHLLYLLAVLNSTACFWHIANISHVYDRGYSRLELSTLGSTRIPSFSSADRGLVRSIIRLAEARLEATGNSALQLEREIDDLVADLYGLNASERLSIGLDGSDGL